MYGWLVAVIAATLANTQASSANFRISMAVTKQFLTVHEVSNSVPRLFGRDFFHYS